MEKFENAVSLGSFCSPAKEFERIGRREFSLPFDWLITPELKTVLRLMEVHFEDFLKEDLMYQLKDYPAYYRNVKWQVDFYHDFSPLASFDQQIGGVTEKYNRRIERFYQVISRPTLFCRYLTLQDLPFVEEHYEEILAFLKSFNSQNEILFVMNDDCPLPSRDLPIFTVPKDAHDTVARVFLKKNKDLHQYVLESVAEKRMKKPNPFKKLFVLARKVYLKLRIQYGLIYRHSREL